MEPHRLKSVLLNRQSSGEHDLRFARIAAANLPDAIVLFAAALQFGFYGAMIFERHDKDHAHAHVERAEQIVALEFAERGEVGKNGRHGPRAQFDFRRAPRGSTRGKFPVMPPPVMCAIAESQPRATVVFSIGQ